MVAMPHRSWKRRLPLRWPESRSSTGAPSRVYFFVEADRGTIPIFREGLKLSSFARKLRGYAETWQQNIHRKRFGFDRFRVVTVTNTTQRAEHLAAAAKKLKVPPGLFLFTDAISVQSERDFFFHRWRTHWTGSQP